MNKDEINTRNLGRVADSLESMVTKVEELIAAIETHTQATTDGAQDIAGSLDGLSLER